MKLFLVEHASSHGMTESVVIADDDAEAIKISESKKEAEDFKGPGRVSMSCDFVKGQIATFWGISGIT